MCQVEMEPNTNILMGRNEIYVSHSESKTTKPSSILSIIDKTGDERLQAASRQSSVDVFGYTSKHTELFSMTHFRLKRTVFTEPSYMGRRKDFSRRKTCLTRHSALHIMVCVDSMDLIQIGFENHRRNPKVVQGFPQRKRENTPWSL